MARLGSRYLLFVVSLVMGVSVSVGQICQYDQIRECFRDLSETIATSNDYYTLCTAQTDMVGQIANCLDPINSDTCTEQQKAELQGDQVNTQDAFDAKCRILPTTTTMAPTPPPVPCDTDAGWKMANDHIEMCIARYKTLDRFQYAMQLTKYGICRNVQAMLDCMYEEEGLNSCPAYKQAFGRQLISYIKLGHLFGCALKLQGNDVLQRNPTSECNMWDWLACHDSLFERLPGLNTVSENTDLNSIINYNVPAITSGLALDRTGCSQYNTRVQWNSIKRCRADLEDKCKLLDVPRRDDLWIKVLDLVYELKIGIYDKIYTLLGIENICAPGCDNLLTRIAQVDTECKHNAGLMLPKQIMDKVNQGMDITAECSKLANMKVCLDGVKGDCPFLEQSIVFNLHNDNAWNLVFDICKKDIQVESNGRCTAEAVTASKILTDCSFQVGVNNRKNLLRADVTKDTFCYFLQTATNCYAQNVAHCPALERRYWSAELPLMHAANQMLDNCNVAFTTYGGLKVSAVEKGRCDMTRWVGCLGDLWSALGVTTPSNKLDLAGFKALLELVWNDGEAYVWKARCSKVQGLDYDAMERCVSGLSMNCDYPMLTLPDGHTYKQQLRDPFNITGIGQFVARLCSPDCTDTDVGEQVKTCLSVENDLTVASTYPSDIIVSAYLRQHDKSKCSTITQMKNCLEYHLDPLKCTLYNAGLVQTATYNEAIDICKNPPKERDRKPTTGASAATSSIVIILLSALLSYTM